MNNNIIMIIISLLIVLSLLQAFQLTDMRNKIMGNEEMTQQSQSSSKVVSSKSPSGLTTVPVSIPSQRGGC